MIKYFLVLLILLCGDHLIGQSVESFIQMAKEKNPGLEALRMDYAAARERANQVIDYPDPQVNLGLGILPIETRLGAQRVRIGVTQAIPWKGLLNARQDMVSSQAEILSNIDEVKEIDIEYAIRTAYSQLIFLNDKRIVIESKLDLLEIMDELAKSGVRSGKGKLSNVLLVQRSKDNLELDLGLLEKQAEPATILINRWAGRPLDEQIIITQNISIPKDSSAYIAYAESGHPQFQIFENRIKASMKAVDLTHFESKPKIGVGLDYAMIFKRGDMNPSGNGRDVLMPMGMVTIPLNTGRFESKRQEEKLRQEAIKASMDDVKESFKAEIANAYSSIEYSEMEIQKMENLKSITRETLDLMRNEYASEGTRFEELLRLEMEFVDYELIIATAKFKKLLAQATLNKYE